MTELRPREKILQTLRRSGESPERLAELKRELPDPVDLEHDSALLQSYGINRATLEDRMGGSP